MSTSRLSNEAVTEFLTQVDRESDELEASLFGPSAFGNQSTDLFQSPNFIEVVHILLADPMLTVPCLNWLHQKQAVIATAKLEALYSPEELTAMREKMQ